MHRHRRAAHAAAPAGAVSPGCARRSRAAGWRPPGRPRSGGRARQRRPGPDRPAPSGGRAATSRGSLRRLPSGAVSVSHTAPRRARTSASTGTRTPASRSPWPVSSIGGVGCVDGSGGGGCVGAPVTVCSQGSGRAARSRSRGGWTRPARPPDGSVSASSHPSSGATSRPIAAAASAVATRSSNRARVRRLSRSSSERTISWRAAYTASART